MTRSVKKFLQVGLTVPMAVIAITAASCGGSTSQSTNPGEQGQTADVCDSLKPLPLPPAPTPSPGPELLTCLMNLLGKVGTLSEGNKAGEGTPEHWSECKDALATWHAWIDRQNDGWFRANNMPRTPPGNCGPQPTPKKR